MDQGANREGLDEAERPLREKVAYLRSPAAYSGVSEVDTRETRMAWVFLAGQRVYKLKKPVRHAYLDYTTLEARHWVCTEEVRLNRRLAPDVYLGVARLTREPDGALAINGAGEVIDWLVEMRRLPRTQFLDEAIRSGKVSPPAIEAVADRLARFYGKAARAEIDPADRLAALAGEIEKAREVLSEKQFTSLAVRGRKVLRTLGEFLSAAPETVSVRIEAGRIVEGHGDLKPEHVCLTDPPVIIDCLEFSRELRLIDPFDELTYLSMECAVLGAGWIGPLVMERCCAALEDRPPNKTLAFYRAYRAALRARQALEHLLEPKPRTPGKWLPLAQRYFAEAERAAVSLRPR